MNGPDLSLPAPAATLWRAVGDTVREQLREISDQETPYAIGGGSILAARWKHRHSYDIDLVLDPDTPLGMLAEENNPATRFESSLRALGGKPTFYPGARLWLVEFDGGKRKLDVWATALLLGAGQQECTIDGERETALSSAQILRGKLERADAPLARDVFDIVKAGEKEHAALEAAVNAVGRDTAERIAQVCHFAAPTIAEAAAEALSGVPPDEHIEPRELGNRAAHAITNALYTKCLIRTRNGRIEVTTETNSRKETTTVVEPTRADDYFEATGLNAYLQPQGPGAKALVSYAGAACGEQRESLVFEADARGLQAWRTAKSAMNPIPGSAADTDHRRAASAED